MLILLMSTSEGISAPDSFLADLAAFERQAREETNEAPPVVAVLVTTDPGPSFEAVAASIVNQDYPALTLLVVDAGSEFDLSSRVGLVAPAAITRRLSNATGIADAVNEALGAVEGASFYFLIDDETIFAPSALRIMVEEAYRSNAGIVGPKLVNPANADEPDTLREVGRSIDRFGGSHTGIEPNEVDQEQHDSVRDVFFVSSSALLVRADLFAALHGFDPETSPGSEDLDLCWRAWLIGARVVVAPDAVGRVEETVSASRSNAQKSKSSKGDKLSLRGIARARMRVLMICYSRLTLAWLMPLGLIASSIQALVLLPTHNRYIASSEFRAWWWSIFHFRRVRTARKAAQGSRVIHDSDLRELQVGMYSRFDAFLDHSQADERIESVGDRVGSLVDRISDGLRSPAAIGLVMVLIVFVFGARDLLTQGVPAVGSFSPWPGIRGMLTEFSSVWRHTGLGSDAFAPPVLVIMSVFTAILFGADGLAETLVVVGSAVVGAFGAYRMMRMLASGIPAAITTAIVYALLPVWRNSIAGGRLGVLILYSLLPFMIVLIVRAAGFHSLAGRSRRPLLGLALVTALAAAWYPPAALAGVFVAVTLLISAIFVGGFRASLRAIIAAVISVVATIVLLIPWSLNLLRINADDRAYLGLSYRSTFDISEILRFNSGPAGAGIAVWGILVAALVSLLIARGPRLAWATRAWVLAVAGYAVAWVPGQIGTEQPLLVPEVGLTIAAIGIAAAVGISIDVLVTEPRDLGKRISRPLVRGLLLTVVIAGVTLGGFGYLGDSGSGRWGAPDGSWSDTLAFTQDALSAGEFRILWLGDPTVLPFTPFTSDGDFGWTMTRNGSGDARQLLRAPETETDRKISEAISSAVNNNTQRLGHLLAPSGIRYVALPMLNGPSGLKSRPQPAIKATLGDQLDLARLRTEAGLVLYENQSWIPASAVVPEASGDEVPLGNIDPLRSSVDNDITRARPVDGSKPVPAGTIVLSEAFDTKWQAQADGKTLRHRKAFGLVNGWDNGSRSSVAITYSGQGPRYLFIILQILLWLFVLGWWFKSRDRQPRNDKKTKTERRERPSRFDPSPTDDLDDFWGEV